MNAARGAPAASVNAEVGSRIVHTFDFDEPDNPYSIPKYWIRFPDRDFPDPEFPRFTEGRFDEVHGHEAPPSLYLETRGRSVAYRYLGPATRIKPGEYLVSGWIRPDRLRHARAVISAYYLNWESEYIEGTQRFSRLIGPQDESGWERVRVPLPQATSEAFFVGVTCWVIQEEVWRADAMPHRHISLNDIEGGAWFDDIVVLGLPRLMLTSALPGCIVEAPARMKLHTSIADEDTAGLSGKLIVLDGSGDQVFAAGVPVHNYDDARPIEVELSEFEPGLYRANLEVYSAGEPILMRTLSFAVLGESLRSRNAVARNMGVAFSELPTDGVDDELALITALGAGAIKLPLWTGNPADGGPDEARDELQILLDEMLRKRVTVVGTLAGPPSEMVRSAGAYARSLLDILSEDSRGWRDHLNAVVAPYASIFNSWQVGADADPSVIEDPRLGAAMDALHAVMREMIVQPSLTAIGAATVWPEGRLPAARNISVHVPNDILPEFVAEHLSPYMNLGYERVWASIPLPRDDRFDDEMELGQWALRIIEARSSGVDAVFVEQPWHCRMTHDGPVSEPLLPYLVYRTVVEILGENREVARLELGPTARALVLGDGSEATVVLWDPASPPEGRGHVLQLGRARGMVDIWGRRHDLEMGEDGRHEITVGPVPVFVTGMEQWLAAFRAGMRLSPRKIDFGFDGRSFELTLTNTHEQPISGEATLHVPDSWEVEPRRLRFSLYPGETRAFPFSLRHPNSETAGRKTVEVAMTLTSEPKYRLNVPLSFDLGLSDVDVWGHAFFDGEWLVIRQSVTSRADHPLSFRTFAMFPGRSRQYRSINELLPGQAVTIEYRFKDASDAAGRNVRLGLREVNGPRIHNLEVVVP